MRLFNLFQRTTSTKFIPEIDALRFFAIMPVLWMHAGTAILKENVAYDLEVVQQTSYLRNMQLIGIGVPLFFGISGFILALPFLSGKQSTIKKYFLRRLIRIEPPYIVALILFLGVHIFLNEKDLSFLLERFWQSLLYISNFAHPNQYPYILPVAWSLEIEVQFYLIMPLLAFLLSLQKTPIWRYLVYGAFLSSSIFVDLFEGKDLNDYMLYFISGILAADLFNQNLIKRHLAWDLLFLACLGVLCLTPEMFLLTKPLRALVIFMMIISGLHCTFLKGFLNFKPIVIIGGMCYSLYLLHYPFYLLISKFLTNKLFMGSSFESTYLVQGSILITLSILLISFYFLLIEKPFMKLSKTLTSSKKKSAVTE